jgi:dihydroflavonol-4-reductase
MPADSLDRPSFKEADLLQDKGWQEAMEGCTYVLHIATPVSGADIVEVSRDSTRRILTAASAAGVKRFVYTSSSNAVGEDTVNGPASYTEDDWTDPEKAALYTRSKILTERDVWGFASEHTELEVTVIVPTMVQGPLLTDHIPASVEILSYVVYNRLPLVAQMHHTIINVHDLARAYRLALETPEAAGRRYICGSELVTIPQAAGWISKQYPDRKIPTRKMPNLFMRLLALSTPEAKNLIPYLGTAITYSSERAKQTILDTADALIAMEGR